MTLAKSALPLALPPYHRLYFSISLSYYRFLYSFTFLARHRFHGGKSESEQCATSKLSLATRQPTRLPRPHPPSRTLWCVG